MVQEDQEEEGEAAEVNQVQPLVPAAGQVQSTPITPPVVQGRVPADLFCLLRKFHLFSRHYLQFNPMLDSNSPRRKRQRVRVCCGNLRTVSSQTPHPCEHMDDPVPYRPHRSFYVT